jgi:hypothetical protein
MKIQKHVKDDAEKNMFTQTFLNGLLKIICSPSLETTQKLGCKVVLP